MTPMVIITKMSLTCGIISERTLKLENSCICLEDMVHISCIILRFRLLRDKFSIVHFFDGKTTLDDSFVIKALLILLGESLWTLW